MQSPNAPSARPTTTALSGNQACARGALEAGIGLATGYPGTPATAAIEYLLALRQEGVRVEWAVNEKVALEVAIGHSWAGQRSFVAMKMSGLNVASDALLSLATSGTRGGLVIYVGDDPGVYYGMVEQDSRWYARMAFLPMVEPGTPAEARELTQFLFSVSEDIGVPLLVRGTTTTANTCAPVPVAAPSRQRRKSDLPFDLDRFTKAGTARCQAQHRAALERLQSAGEALDSWNRLEQRDGELAVIATASVWGYVEECLQHLASLPSTLRITVVNPLPDTKILSVLEGARQVLVVEELDSVVEERVRALCAGLPNPPRVFGKADGLLDPVGDLSPEAVGAALANLGHGPAGSPGATDAGKRHAWPARSLTFCPGCPHRSTYTALERALAKLGLDKDQVIVTGDIGCTIIGMNPPHGLCRTELAMGSSIAIAQGLLYAGIETPVIATIGDSTFFHAGLPPLIHAAAQGVNLTVLVLDNHYASMTGHQPSPSNLRSRGEGAPNPMSIEDLAKAARVHRVRKALPYNTKRLARLLVQAIKSPGVNVVITEAPCAARIPRKTVIPMAVRDDRCVGVAACESSCVAATGCPALWSDGDEGRARVDADRCTGCGLCAEVCTRKAIRRSLGKRRLTF